jgi:hypothetical protein
VYHTARIGWLQTGLAHAVPGGPWALATIVAHMVDRDGVRREAVEVRESPGVGDQGRLREDVFRDHELKNLLSKLTGTREQKRKVSMRKQKG